MGAIGLTTFHTRTIPKGLGPTCAPAARHLRGETIRLPDLADPVELRATIRRLSDGGPDSDWNIVGLEFDVPDDDPSACIEALATFVANCQREIARKLIHRAMRAELF